MKFSLQVQLNADFRDSVLRLPPGFLAILSKRGNDIFNAVTDGVGQPVKRPSGVTDKALLLILKMTHNTIGLRSLEPTG